MRKRGTESVMGVFSAGWFEEASERGPWGKPEEIWV